ncbi:hypothetical protein [Cohnella sp. WQ 127256]|uniref:hypothetical protein n=1 Tax=Cohnella sp. WQ 127256 TaxID=2938790 RepID=UPI00211929E6|nr:hypothetical protein [Cohnella sp. WQ 127256]
MKNRILTLFALAMLMISMPALIGAAPGEHHHSDKRPVIDWNSYPADIQALKIQLDNIKTEQKSLFEQMKAQHDQIRDARNALSSDQRNTLKDPAKQLILQMKTTRDEIHALRSQKHEAWDSFYDHSAKKQWSSAKSDLQTVINQKQQIIVKQKSIVKLQNQLITLIKPTTQMHIHSEE